MAKNRNIEHQPLPHDHHQTPDPNLRPMAVRRLKITFLIAIFLFFSEFIGAWISSSLALLADSFHVLGDLTAVSVTLLATFLADRLKSSRRSYGYYRLEVLAALFNGFLLIILAASIFQSAIHRIREPHTLNSELMLGISIVGLIANILMVKTLHGAHEHNLNIRSAYLHLLGDSISSVVVIVCALVIMKTGWSWLDPVGGILVAMILVIMAGRLIWDSVHVLLEGTPKHMDPDEVAAVLRTSFPQISNIHDFHIWEITSHLFAMTAHVEAKVRNLEETRALIDGMNQLIKERYGIGHTTFQVEPS